MIGGLIDNNHIKTLRIKMIYNDIIIQVYIIGQVFQAFGACSHLKDFVNAITSMNRPIKLNELHEDSFVKHS